MLNNFTKTNLSFTLRAILALILICGNFNIAFAGPDGDSRPPLTDTPPPTNTPAGAATPKTTPPPQVLTGSDSRQQYSTFNVKDILTVGSDSPEGKTVGSQDQKYLQSSHPVAAFILQIINLLTLTAASLSFLGVVVGGFMMVSSAGQEGQITKGKEAIKMALLGLVLTLSSYFIVAFVQNLLFESAGK